MALIKVISEIKEVLPKLVSNLNASSLLPNFNAVEEKYLTPMIGDALYADLQTKFDAGTLTADEKILVKHMRLVIASYGFLDETAATHVFLTDQGVRVNSTSNMQKAVGWEYKELKKYLTDRAADGIEVLLKYLWKKKADLGLWTASDEYKQFEGLLIRTGTDFNEWYKLYQPMRTFYAIKDVLKNAQKYYLVSGLGADLVSYLVKLAAPVAKEKEIIEELKSGLAHFTIKHACEKFEVRFSDAGFTITGQVMGGDQEGDDSGRTGATIQVIKRVVKACDRDGKNFILSAKRLLVAFRKSGTSSVEFNTAFDAGPLYGYLDPKDQESWNRKCKRKGFRT